ncbi:hypothetical protein [Labrenzia sp. VG12]|uniref:hypothetical protein n=1 Tax=Labrenzia sp. VG12 TaxID=2021862 RepID=UPI000B8C2AD8|nr:hypothetical protein [Labrenzia sp. VG12]ASP31997.1 hypothetical protein CHH27_01040 [Labrenzia sp. VG12]
MKRFFCLLLVLIFPTAALACSSPDLNSNEDFFRNADRVFIGFVHSIEYLPPEPGKPFLVEPGSGPEHAPPGLIKVGYDVSEVLKGPENDSTPVVTWNLYLGGCGVQVLAGAEMLFLVKDFGTYLSAEEMKTIPEGVVGMILPNSFVIMPTDAAHDATLAEWQEVASRVAD